MGPMREAPRPAGQRRSPPVHQPRCLRSRPGIIVLTLSRDTPLAPFVTDELLASDDAVPARRIRQLEEQVPCHGHLARGLVGGDSAETGAEGREDDAPD